jgi:SPX domain protein involved in polyphosphate accumulation
MKFGKQLIFLSDETWEDNYLDYKGLNDIIKDLSKEPTNEEIIKQFNDTLLKEIIKVNEWYKKIGKKNNLTKKYNVKELYYYYSQDIQNL